MINTPLSTNIGRFTGTSVSTVIGFDFANTVTPFSPKSLFTEGKQGAWFDPSDKSTLFQDAAGTIPVTKDGDPVALMRDKSGNGNHAIQTVSASRPTYQTDGVLHWLKSDGVDDKLIVDYAVDLPAPAILSVGFNKIESKVFQEYIGARTAEKRHQLSTSSGLQDLFVSGTSGGTINIGNLSLGNHAITAIVNGADSLVKYDSAVKTQAQTNVDNDGIRISGANIRTYAVVHAQLPDAATVDEVHAYIAKKSGVTL